MWHSFRFIATINLSFNKSIKWSECSHVHVHGLVPTDLETFSSWCFRSNWILLIDIKIKDVRKNRNQHDNEMRTNISLLFLCCGFDLHANFDGSTNFRADKIVSSTVQWWHDTWIGANGKRKSNGCFGQMRATGQIISLASQQIRRIYHFFFQQQVNFIIKSIYLHQMPCSIFWTLFTLIKYLLLWHITFRLVIENTTTNSNILNGKLHSIALECVWPRRAPLARFLLLWVSALLLHVSRNSPLWINFERMLLHTRTQRHRHSRTSDSENG